MESALNLVWIVLVAGMMLAWARCAARNGANRRMQLVAFAALAFILLPAISMTDDLIRAQNPAEADWCLRRDHGNLSLRMPDAAAAAAPTAAFAGLAFTDVYYKTAGLTVRLADSRLHGTIQNRPPPAA